MSERKPRVAASAHYFGRVAPDFKMQHFCCHAAADAAINNTATVAICYCLLQLLGKAMAYLRARFCEALLLCTVPRFLLPAGISAAGVLPPAQRSVSVL